MREASSILVVVNRSRESSGLVNKAIQLARGCGAPLELFLCDSEQAYELAHSYDRERIESARAESIADGRSYLRQLRANARATDVEITIDAQCESPLYEGVVHKVLRSSPQLVLKAVTALDAHAPRVPDPNDWELIRTCPVAVMLARGRTWHAPPRFAAAIDVSERENSEAPGAVLQEARRLASGSGGELDVIYCEEGTAAQSRLERLKALCEDAGIPFNRRHVIYGRPEDALGPLVIRQGHDVLVLGALTHYPPGTTLLGTLTSKLLDSADCDLVLVKPSSYRSPIER